jgi:hypothetical protein
MALYHLSGISDENDMAITITADNIIAESSFLKLVQNNVFGIKDLLLSDTIILNGQIKAWYEQQGYSFAQLLVILNQ